MGFRRRALQIARGDELTPENVALGFLLMAGGRSLGQRKTVIVRKSFLAVRGAICVLAVTLWVSGCASLTVRDPVPKAEINEAQIPGYTHIRYTIGDPSTVVELIRDVAVGLSSAPPSDQPVSMLALSGGGANGAFGAGMLCGWTAHGDRPQFQVVTGVSAGALIAPFVFLGPAYDDKLKEVFTTVTDHDIFRLRWIFSISQGDSVTTTEPMIKTLARYIDAPMLAKIGEEYRRGRRLYVCTTDLDSQRPVIWNLGKIAASGRPDAPQLFYKVIVASASVPIAFPPQYLKVEANGHDYDEMHVDGGVITQVFLPLTMIRAAMNTVTDERTAERPIRAYIIRNGKVTSEWAPTTPSLLSITRRTIETLTRTQGIGDLYRLFVEANAEHVDFNLAFVPAGYEAGHKGVFDPKYMDPLFNLGYRLANDGYAWAKTPPYFEASPNGDVLPEAKEPTVRRAEPPAAKPSD